MLSLNSNKNFDLIWKNLTFVMYTRASQILTPPEMAPQEIKPIGHRNCINTPPSHKHFTIKQRRCVKTSEREHHAFAN